MKLVLREYVSSLRERDELDAMLPNLLTELGYTVFSRPGRGTRQYGVDIAALGPEVQGERKVYLFSIKQGDLTRADWDGNEQALRASINQIRDVYIPTSIPTEYRHLKVVISLVFGGDVREAVRLEFEQYLARETTPTLTFEEWNGDRLADLILAGLLREELFPDPLRSHLRKAVAMVGEPDIAFNHFRKLVDAILSRPSRNHAARVTKIREINICLGILFTWARDAGNVEAPYRASEYAILHVWELAKAFVGNGRPAGDAAGLALNELIEQHFSIWDTLSAKLLPHADKRHALSVAVGSYSSLDVNLKLHEMLGRMALRGLWIAWQQAGEAHLPIPINPNDGSELDLITRQVFEIIDKNPALQSPITDDETIDITLALMLLGMNGRFSSAISSWVEALIQRTRYAFYTHTEYPTSKTSYWDLAGHPTEKTDEYREAATAGSTLYPTLLLWAVAFGNADASKVLSEFATKSLKHCNMQLWFPNDETEAAIWTGGLRHGDMLSDIPLTADGVDTFEYVGTECEYNADFDRLSAVAAGQWPILLMACRQYRIPVPPQIWLGLLPSKPGWPPAKTEALLETV